MGSVYGVFGQMEEGRFGKELLGLKKWNYLYGKLHSEDMCSNALFGGNSDLLTSNASLSGGVIKRGHKLCTIDAVIFNRDELIAKYKLDDKLKDEDIIFEIISNNGYDCLTEVNGDFAGAIYDDEENSLILFRDHMGVRPLYYYMADKVVFSTDIRGIVAVNDVPVDVNPAWVYTLWHGNYLSDRRMTNYAYIFCVLPGSYLKFYYENGKLQRKEKVFWTAGEKKIRLKSFEDYKKEMSLLVKDAIKRRADVVEGELASELSGGIDSGVVSILLNQMERKVLFHSWSQSPEEIPYAENDERYNIEAVCKQEKIKCHFSGEIGIQNECSAISQNMKNIGLVLLSEKSNPYAFPPFVNTLQICESSDYAAKNGAKVVFTGHGGDEGISHRANPFEMFYNHEYYHYCIYMWKTMVGRRSVIKYVKRIINNLIVGYNDIRKPFCEEDDSRFLLSSFEIEHSKRELKPFYFRSNLKKYIQNGGSRGRLDNVALQGGCSGVRYFIPFLDYRVIDFALSIPRYCYLNPKINRYIYREAFKDILPKELYECVIKEDTSHINVRKKKQEEFNKNKENGIKVITINELLKEKIDLVDGSTWKKIINVQMLADVVENKNLSTKEFYSVALKLDKLIQFDSVNDFVRSIEYGK